MQAAPHADPGPPPAHRLPRTPPSLKWRLSLLLSGLFVVLFVIATSAFLASASTGIGRESQAARQLAEVLLRAAPQQDGRPILGADALDGLRAIRHLDLLREGEHHRDRSPVAGWFANIYRDPAPPAGSDEAIPIWIANPDGPPARASLVPIPDDELAEVWSNASDFAAFAVSVLLLLNAGSWLIVHFELRPLAELRAAFDRLAHGEQAVLLPPCGVAELAPVHEGFNRMARELDEADADRRRLLGELIRVQEAERRAIARELHDEFAQHMTAIDFEALAVERALPGTSPNAPPSALAGLRSIRASVQTMIRLVRERLTQLRPEALDEFGIGAALDDLIARFRSMQPGIAVESAIEEPLELADEAAIAVYRVVQEALTNVARHAQASRVRVELVRRDAQLHLQISDDGRGIGGNAGRGFGLPGMRERVAALGGQLVLEAGDGPRGTRIRIQFPLGARR